MTKLQRALVLRPEGRGEALSALLRGEGWEVVEAPLMAFEAGPDLPQLTTQLARLQSQDLVIAVSRSLLPFVTAALPAPWSCPALRIAVGGGTAAALAAAGLGDWQIPARADSEGVVALADTLHGQGRRALLLRGDQGRTLIADTLRQRGFALTELACYRRQARPPASDQLDRWHSDGIDTLILTSAEALDILLHHSNNRHRSWLADCLWVTASQRIADAIADRLGATRVRVAAGADNAELATALRQESGRQGECHD